MSAAEAAGDVGAFWAGPEVWGAGRGAGLGGRGTTPERGAGAAGVGVARTVGGAAGRAAGAAIVKYEKLDMRLADLAATYSPAS